jgi:hypothetical protein
MATIYNRRDIAFTIISRFEETYRRFLIDKLSNKYSDFKQGIPSGIVTKLMKNLKFFIGMTPKTFLKILISGSSRNKHL